MKTYNKSKERYSRSDLSADLEDVANSLSGKIRLCLDAETIDDQ